MNIEEQVIIRPNVTIGTGTTIKCGAILGTGVKVGKDSYIGPGAMLLHMRPNGESNPSEIGNRVFIGGNAVICPGVKIVDGVIIGAGSVVTKSILKPGVYAGNPARPIDIKMGRHCIVDSPIKLGNHVFIANYVHIRPHVEIGDYSEIRDHCFLAEGCKIGINTRIMQYSNIGAGTIIGDNCFVGVRVTTTNDHEITYPKSESGWWKKDPPVIENNVRIGSGAIILPGVILATNSRIGAGSVVTKSTEPGFTYVGNPAKRLDK